MNIYDLALAGAIYSLYELNYFTGSPSTFKDIDSEDIDLVYLTGLLDFEELFPSEFNEIIFEKNNRYHKLLVSSSHYLEICQKPFTKLVLDPFPDIKAKLEYAVYPKEFNQLKPEESLARQFELVDFESIRLKNIELFKTRFAVLAKQFRARPETRYYAIIDLIEKHLYGIGCNLSLYSKAVALSSIFSAQAQFYDMTQNEIAKDKASMALLSLEVYNMKEFILDGERQVSKGFFIQQILHNFALKICRDFEIPYSNVIDENQNAFEIILPNLQDELDNIHKQLKELNRWLFEITGLSLVVSVVPLKLDDIADFKNYFEKYLEKKQINMQRPGLGIIHDGKEFIKNHNFSQKPINCNKLDESNIKFSKFCNSMNGIRENIGNNSWILCSSDDILQFDAFFGSWSYAEMPDIEWIKTNCLIDDDNEIKKLLVEAINDYSYQALDFGFIRNRWLFQQKPIDVSEMKTFGAVYSEIDYIPVDSFQSFIDKRLNLKRFLSLHLNDIINRKYSDSVSIILIDSKRIFAIGKWHKVLEFIRDLNYDFRRFSADKIKIRSGFALCSINQSLQDIYEIAKSENKRLKSSSKEVKALSSKESYGGFSDLLDQAIKITMWYSRGLIDRNIINKLLDSAEKAKKILQSPDCEYERLENHLYSSEIARVYGYFWRRGEINREVRNWLQKLIYNPMSEERKNHRMRISRLVFPLKYALLSIDEEA